VRRKGYTKFSGRYLMPVLLIVFCGTTKATTSGAPAGTATIAEYAQPQTEASAQFCNQSAIAINDNAPATPYPSTINVSGLTGLVSKVTVTLKGLRHTFPRDIDLLLVGPHGGKVELMAHAGGNFSITDADVTFDDAAPSYLPSFGLIISGAYRPSNHYPPYNPFPAPAPATSMASPYGATLMSFNGTNPNGMWSLYVVDDHPSDAGQINGGWCLNIWTTPNGGLQPTLVTGAIDRSDSIQHGRLTRNSINSLSPMLKSFPGVADSQPRHFVSYSFTNKSDANETVTATLTCGCGTDLFLAAYLNSYDQHGLATNYRADNGFSFGSTGLPMSFDVPPGATFVLVVNQITWNSSCPGYSLLVEGNVSYNGATASKQPTR
jgi:subtilisin-like proprotein convertase family protein